MPNNTLKEIKLKRKDMERLIIILSLLICFTSCDEENENPEYYYFDSKEQNMLGFKLNDTVTYINDSGIDYNFKIVKDSLYHREYNAIITGTSFVQHNDIMLTSIDTNNLFIRIEAEKANYFEYLLEIGELPYSEYSYFYYRFNSSIQDFEIIDTVIDSKSYSGLYTLRSEQFNQNTNTLVLMNSENGIVLIEKVDNDSNVIFRLKKK